MSIITLSSGYLLFPPNEITDGYHLRTSDYISAPYRLKLPPTTPGKAIRVRKKKTKTPVVSVHNAFMLGLDSKFSAAFAIALDESRLYFPLTGMEEASIESYVSGQIELARLCHLATNANIVFGSTQLTPSSVLNLSDLIHVHYLNHKESIHIIIDDRTFFIPSDSQFIISELTHFTSHLPTLPPFDLIVMDPPWPNKSVNRSDSYAEMDIYDLFSLSIKNSINPGGLVCVWVTNKEKYHSFIKHKLFPAWGLETVAEWVWIKVTTQGDPVSDVGSMHRKPYEVCIIGRRRINIDDILEFPTKVIVSVPSKHHSRKPPLGDTLQWYFDKQKSLRSDGGGSESCVGETRRLELFARCVTKGWTCWGNETLRFNDSCYFEEVKCIDGM